MDPVSAGLSMLALLRKHWKLAVGGLALLLIGLYVATLKVEIASLGRENTSLKTQRDEMVGSVRATLEGLGVKRTVEANTVAEEFAWLAGEYRTVNGALRAQSAALEAARDEAAMVRANLQAALSQASAARRERNALAESIRNRPEGGLTDEEWSQL